MSNSSLIAHAGTHIVPRAALRNIPTPPPQGTRHAPIAHLTLVELIEASANRVGLELAKETISVGRTKGGFPGTAMFGVMDFKTNDPNRGRCLGFRASNWMQHSIQLIAGQRVFVCDNGVFSGETILLRQRHVRGMNLSEAMREAFDSFLSASIRLEYRADRLQERECTEEHASRLLLDAAVNKVLPGRIAVAAWEQFIRPEDGATDVYVPGTSRNLSQVEGAVTRVLRGAPVHLALDHTQTFAKFLDAAARLN